MHLRIGLSVLCLLASLLLAGTAAAQPPDIRAGSLEIALDPTAVSFLPIDSQALRYGLCGGKVPRGDGDSISPSGECDVSAGVTRSFHGDLRDGITSHDGHWLVSLEPTEWGAWQAAEPVATACGLWDVSMGLDPGAEQPTSELALEPAAGDPAQGVFAGVVKFAVHYIFANRDNGESLELPTVVSLELSGHWAAVPKDGPSPGDGASNLVLFAGFFDGKWSTMPACVTWGGVDCRVCLRASPDVLEKL